MFYDKHEHPLWARRVWELGQSQGPGCPALLWGMPSVPLGRKTSPQFFLWGMRVVLMDSWQLPECPFK